MNVEMWLMFHSCLIHRFCQIYMVFTRSVKIFQSYNPTKYLIHTQFTHTHYDNSGFEKLFSFMLHSFKFVNLKQKMSAGGGVVSFFFVDVCLICPHHIICWPNRNKYIYIKNNISFLSMEHFNKANIDENNLYYFIFEL